MRFYSTVALVLAVARVSTSLDPNSVDIAERKRWCEMQQTSCPLLCLQLPGGTANTQKNTCDPDTLVYECICNNGKSPNASEYSQTIPYFICTETNNQCVAACGQNNNCASGCRQNNPCGASDPKRYNSTSSASASGASSTGTASGTSNPTDPASYTGFGTGGSSSTSGAHSGTGAAATAMNLGQAYGLAVVAAAFFGGFALVL